MTIESNSQENENSVSTNHSHASQVQDPAYANSESKKGDVEITILSDSTRTVNGNSANWSPSMRAP